MLLKYSAIAVAAAALCTTVGAAPASAQQNCGFMYQRVMEAYQAQSPHYGQMLNHYNARCLSGGSSQPAWEGDHHRYDWRDQDRRGYEDRPGYGGGRWRWGG